MKRKKTMKKAINYTLTGLLAVFLSGNIIAQDNQTPGEVFIEQAPFEHNEAVQQFTDRFVSTFQIDSEFLETLDPLSNVAVINQFGSGNISILSQTGTGNIAGFDITGNDNYSNLIQFGNSNQFILELFGNSNELFFEQLGSDNQLIKNLNGNGMQQSYRQEGNGLHMQIIDYGQQGVPMHIEQSGDGSTIIIENH
jgi:hypothetical protein